jgi:hypothetical protein
MRTLAFGLRAGSTAIALFLLASPGHAVTCEEARGLSAAELRHYAERLEVSAPYLAALLDKAFCDAAAKPGSVTARNDRRDPMKAPDKSNRRF